MKWMCTNPIGVSLGMSIKICILSCLLFPYDVHGNAAGAPPSTCGDMSPKVGHGVDAQTAANPFKLQMDSSQVKPGDKVVLTLNGGGGVQHKGFLILVVKEGSTDEYVGTWEAASNIQSISCSSGKGEAATHKGSAPITAVDETKITWTAPMEEGEHEVFFTVVQDQPTYWVKQSAGKITVKSGDGGGTMSEKPKPPKPVGPMGGDGSTVAPSLLTTSVAMTLLTISCFLSHGLLHKS